MQKERICKWCRKNKVPPFIRKNAEGEEVVIYVGGIQYCSRECKHESKLARERLRDKNRRKNFKKYGIRINNFNPNDKTT